MSEKETIFSKIIKKEIGDMRGACEDWKKGAELGDEDAVKLVQEHCE